MRAYHSETNACVLRALRWIMALLSYHNLPFLHAFQHFDAILALDTQLHIDAALCSTVLNHHEVAPLKRADRRRGQPQGRYLSAPT